MIKWMMSQLFKRNGWSFHPNVPPEVHRCVLVAAPHTSNWDFVYAMASFEIMKIPVGFTIKKEWMKFPVKGTLKSLGAISIDRTPKDPSKPRPSMVEKMASLFEDKKELAIMVTPEGTRSLQKKWKTGFYYVAKKAQVPICLAYVNYEKKEAGVGKVIFPSENMKEDMKEIMNFYQHIPGKYPEKFTVDLDYYST